MCLDVTDDNDTIIHETRRNTLLEQSPTVGNKLRGKKKHSNLHSSFPPLSSSVGNLSTRKKAFKFKFKNEYVNYLDDCKVIHVFQDQDNQMYPCKIIFLFLAML